MRALRVKGTVLMMVHWLNVPSIMNSCCPRSPKTWGMCHHLYNNNRSMWSRNSLRNSWKLTSSGTDTWLKPIRSRMKRSYPHHQWDTSLNLNSQVKSKGLSEGRRWSNSSIMKTFPEIQILNTELYRVMLMKTTTWAWTSSTNQINPLISSS